MYRWPLLLMVLASLLASAQERRAVNFYSKDKEAAIGVSLAADVRKTITIVENAALSQYVERIGRKLAAVLPDSGITYTFHSSREQPWRIDERAAGVTWRIYLHSHKSLPCSPERGGICRHVGPCDRACRSQARHTPGDGSSGRRSCAFTGYVSEFAVSECAGRRR